MCSLPIALAHLCTSERTAALYIATYCRYVSGTDPKLLNPPALNHLTFSQTECANILTVTVTAAACAAFVRTADLVRIGCNNNVNSTGHRAAFRLSEPL